MCSWDVLGVVAGFGRQSAALGSVVRDVYDRKDAHPLCQQIQKLDERLSKMPKREMFMTTEKLGEAHKDDRLAFTDLGVPAFPRASDMTPEIKDGKDDGWLYLSSYQESILFTTKLMISLSYAKIPCTGILGAWGRKLDEGLGLGW